MSSDLQHLLVNIQTTHKAYQHLLELAEKERTHIIHGDIEALREDLQAEERLVAEASKLNSERETLHRRCRLALHAEGDHTGESKRSDKSDSTQKLEDLCRAMPPEWAQRFQRERAGLRRTLEQLLRANRANVVLVNNSLDLMQGLLTALFGGEEVSAYGPRGVRAKAELCRRSLDTNA